MLVKVCDESSTIVADPRGNETSHAIATADLLTCYLRVAEADLLHLSNPSHLVFLMHHPTGTEFLIRRKPGARQAARTLQDASMHQTDSRAIHAASDCWSASPAAWDAFTLQRSTSGRFWLSLNFPSMRVIGIRKPTMPASMVRRNPSGS